MEIDDEIHGKVALSPVCAAFYRHPHFERLRRVRQMGSGWLVFPNATHTRHEHSVGVCHLAGSMLDALGVRDPALQAGGRKEAFFSLSLSLPSFSAVPFSSPSSY